MQNKDILTDRFSISSVVVTYNRKTLLEECLVALSNQTRRLDEIIVIDNASTDGTEELIKTRFANITYVKLQENIGGSGGFHEGIKLAYEKKHDWIWVMDDDAVPLADALEKLVSSPMAHQDKVYALASAVLNRDGSIYLDPRRLFNPNTLSETEVGIDKYKQMYFRMDTASFVGLLISRNYVKLFGLPLKEFFIYYDDTEYSLRIRNTGIMVTVPDSKIIHGAYNNASEELQRRAAKPDFDWKSYYFIRNYIYTYRKHGNAGIKFYLNLILFANFKDIIFRRRPFQRRYRSRNIYILFRAVFDGAISKLGKNNKFLPL